MLLFPLVKFTGDEYIVLNAFQISNGEQIIPLTILISLIIFITLITLFLFKKRILQIRLIIINIILMLGLIGLIYFYVYQIKQFGIYKSHFQFPCLYPIISLILSYLAIRSIGRDEALVRSIDRIR